MVCYTLKINSMIMTIEFYLQSEPMGLGPTSFRRTKYLRGRKHLHNKGVWFLKSLVSQVSFRQPPNFRVDGTRKVS